MDTNRPLLTIYKILGQELVSQGSIDALILNVGSYTFSRSHRPLQSQVDYSWTVPLGQQFFPTFIN